jgi:hypothetical protein
MVKMPWHGSNSITEFLLSGRRDNAREKRREMVDEIKLKPGVKAVFISGYAPDTMHNKA